jgi:hypothetical protein
MVLIVNGFNTPLNIIRMLYSIIIIIIIIIIMVLQPFIKPWTYFQFLDPIHSR